MAGFYSLENKEVIRIKVKKCDGMMQPEYKKFSIDPQITSFEMLQGILAKAFDIKSDFTLSYLAKDSEGQEVYLSMLSDWDMDAAFQCAADPCLKLKVDLKPFDQELDDWDVIAPAEVPQARISSLLDKNSLLGAITSNISSHVGKTMSSMQRAMGLKQADEPYKPLKPPMSDMEFHHYLDSAGFMIKPSEFRLSIYQGGIESSLRRVAWRHLLNIFPENMSGRERFDYLKRKEQEYYSLRDEWKERFASGSTTEEVKYVVSMVKKDVLRTDRSHQLYAGGDDNKNVLSLFHILVTYALTHPDVSYCQGMSDLASPLLVIQKDEAQAYICFCSLMGRMRHNFSPDGAAIMTQFQHLADLLQVHDAPFYDYLLSINAHDLFFCYRWLLLQLKREFPFEDALYMLEVMWSTLPPAPPEHDLPLVDPDYNAKLLSSTPCSPTFSFQQSVYAKLLAMRCSTKARGADTTGGGGGPQAASKTPHVPPASLLPTRHPATSQGAVFDVSPADEDRGLDYPQIDNVMTRSLQQRSNSIDQVLQDCSSNTLTVPGQDHSKTAAGGDVDRGGSGDVSVADRKASGQTSCPPQQHTDPPLAANSQSESESRSPGPPHEGACSDSSGHCNAASPPVPDCSVTVSGDGEGGGSPEPLPPYASPAADSNHHHRSSSPSSESGPTPSSPSIQESNEETSSPPCQARNDAEDDAYSGFFGSMKKLLTSPKKRPADIIIPSEISSNQSGLSSSSQDTSSTKLPDQPSRSDSGVSDGDTSGSWSSGPTSQGVKPQPPPPPARAQPPSLTLPPPQEFGSGNPFLMFLCLTLLLQHREQIIRSHLGYEDVAMLFDKMVRRHNVHKVLHQARELYTEYLRNQQALAEKDAEAADGLSV
ncbi:uncharacterized protein LOC143285229 isoform X2 [Babylonia areolata]|uniref:uncharacterized protein LOC143285229 isoform X2 n=1 Tax=Babylonia areolata TaxID=304850 RepID=UPI003FD4BFCB